MMAYTIYEWVLSFFIVFSIVVIYNHAKCLYRDLKSNGYHKDNNFMYAYHIGIILLLSIYLIVFL
ncbi:hypothetical protein BvCmsB5655_03737 [Escherichia coli]|nr:hypothetical protein BvCmsB5655_03737 [Escherichia coli]